MIDKEVAEKRKLEISNYNAFLYKWHNVAQKLFKLEHTSTEKAKYHAKHWSNCHDIGNAINFDAFKYENQNGISISIVFR